ncbi:MAG: toll/interleukin-1 receptor domain-containing protein [Myxococcales bacterium]|nr:toll/interleukin-1 receptor domain-containing protein [Myxococcales bacterium]
MARPIVFISYARQDDLAGRDGEAGAGACHAMIEALREQLGHCDLRLDVDIPVAVQWHPQLMRSLGECHAAVVLLSRRALERPWVVIELAILSWRAHLDPRMLLVPVLLDGLQQAEVITLVPWLAPVRPDDFTVVEATGDVHAVVETVGRRLDGVRAFEVDDAMQLWVERLANLLRDIDGALLMREILFLAGGEALPPLLTERSERSMLARQLLYLQDGDLRCGVAGHLRLPIASQEARGGLVEMLTPLWVKAEWVVPIAAMAARPLKRPMALVASRQETAYHHVQRAFVNADHVYIIRVGGAVTPRAMHAHEDELLRRIDAAILDGLGEPRSIERTINRELGLASLADALDDPRPQTHARLGEIIRAKLEQLAKRPRKELVCVVLAPSATLNAQRMRWVRERYQGALLLAPLFDAEALAGPPGDVDVLHSQLSPEDEDAGLDLEDRLHRAVGLDGKC